MITDPGHSRVGDGSDFFLFVNGARHAPFGAATPAPHVFTTLAEYLRYSALLVGTKIGCGEGGCGACTVLVTDVALVSDADASATSSSSTRLRHRPANACITPLLALHSCHVTTIEALGDTSCPHAIQRRVAEWNASQCGFCTPGMVMSLYGRAVANATAAAAGCPPARDDDAEALRLLGDMEDALQGNLCRCTGYRPLLDVAKSFAATDAGGGATAPAVLRAVRQLAPGDTATAVDEGPSATEPPTPGTGLRRNVCSTEAALRSLRGRGAPLALEGDENLRRAEACFTPEVRRACVAHSLAVAAADGSRWLQPASLDALVAALHDSAQQPQLISGNGGFYGARHAFLAPGYDAAAAARTLLISTMNVRELGFVRFDDAAQSLVVGARCTLAELEVALRERLHADGAGALLVRHLLRHCAECCHAISSPQLRAWSSAVGHLLSPGADLLPTFAAAGATLQLVPVAPAPSAAHRGGVSVALRDAARDPARHLVGHVVVSVTLPLRSDVFVFGAKGSMRKDHSQGVVAAALAVRIVAAAAPGTALGTATSVTLADPTFAVTCLDASRLFDGDKAVASLAGRALTGPLLDDDAVRDVFGATFAALSAADADASRGRTGFRVAFARSTLVKAWNSAAELLGAGATATARSAVTEGPSSAVVSRGVQVFETSQGNLHHDARHTPGPFTEQRSPVGDPLPVIAALQQATGQAIFVDDIPTPAGCLFAALVLAPCAKGVFGGLDAAPALAMPGVVAVYAATDFPHREAFEEWGERVMCNVGDEFRAIGEPLGLVVARDQLTANRAACVVGVRYAAPAKPAVFDVDGAIAESSYFNERHEVLDGCPDPILRRARANDAAAVVANNSSSSSSSTDGSSGADAEASAVPDGDKLVYVSGVTRCGGQEHFYLEPHAMLAAPGERGEVTLFSQTQCVTKSQALVAKMLGVPQSKINIIVRRMGGAFGGREVRTTYTSAALALAATKLKRPVRWLLTRAEDMRITGGRHPFQATWTIVANRETCALVALECEMHVNGGCTTSITKSVMARGVLHICNAAKIPHVRVVGISCGTNIVSNTAFRGFGANQGMFIMQTMVAALALRLCVRPERILAASMLREGQRTHYGQLVPHCRLSGAPDAMWERLARTAAWEPRLAACAAFNALPESRWVKRGMAMLPTKYGCSFPVNYLNQATATVGIYQDGAVIVHHSAVDMGQGINTKCAQTAARALGAPMASVHVGDATAHHCPNASPTAASMGSDLNCMAIIDACNQINERLAPVRAKLPAGASFADLCAKAYKERVCLAATGHYKTRDVAEYKWDMVTADNSKRGPMYAYYSFGVGAAEVEVDVLTGLFRILRADLLMDCGDSLNAAVDIGQVEGAFVQGYGWLTLEELVFAGDTAHAGTLPAEAPGALVNAGPHGYKIPAFSDVPLDLRVELLSGAPNPYAVHGSKAVGEPPLFLGACVFFAIKDAIDAARVAAGVPPLPVLDAPLTAERIRMACRDAIADDRCGPEVIRTST